MVIAVIAYVFLLLLLAVVSASETSIYALRDVSRALDGVKPGRQREEIQSMLANPFLHMHRTLLVTATLNLALTALGMFLIVEAVARLHANPWLAAVAFFGVTVLLGDVLPKFIAVRMPAIALLHTTRILLPLRRVLDPVALLAERASSWFVRLVVPKRAKARLPITREELETLIEMREEQGMISASEAEILNEILDVTDLTVRDCMIPRVDLTLIEGSDPGREIVDALERSRARFAIIHGETPDTVLGVIEVPRWRLAGRPHWGSLLIQPVFVPETFSALDALRQHLSSASACVLILDEYGGLEGMVTQDEITDWLLYDAAPWQGEEQELRQVDGGRWLADGAVRVDHVAEMMEVDIDAGGIDTIGGFVFTHLGHLPKPGERVRAGNIEVKVRRVSRHRVQQVEIRRV